MKTYPVLSIDAWGNENDGYEWNAWSRAGEISIDINSDPESILNSMADAGFIRNPHLGDIEDDEFNLVIVNKLTREPLFAIEYGSQI